MLSHISQWITDVKPPWLLFSATFEKWKSAPSEKVIHYLCTVSKRQIQKPSQLSLHQPSKERWKIKKIDIIYSLFHFPQNEKDTVAQNEKRVNPITFQQSSTLQKEMEGLFVLLFCFWKNICINPVRFFQRVGQIWKTQVSTIIKRYQTLAYM